jgi:hypothetical protein
VREPLASAVAATGDHDGRRRSILLNVLNSLGEAAA